METLPLLIKLYIAGAALSFPVILWEARRPHVYLDAGEVLLATLMWPIMWVYVAVAILIDL